MKNKAKNAVLGLMMAAAVIGSAAPTTSVFAATPTTFNNSTASSVSDSNAFSAGSDTSQGQVGKETDQTLGGASASTPTETKTNAVSVYATKSSNVQIKVPQVLIGDATKSTYHVGVKGDITTQQSVTVKPSAATFTLTDTNDTKRTVTANVSQNKETWSCTDILDKSDYVYAKGNISYAELKAGSYNGTFNLGVTLNYQAQ